MQIHVVQSGETIYRIARQYGVTPDAVANVNGLDPNSYLVIGQALVVPTQANTYTVQSGDSLWTIAERFGTTPQEIMRLNAISQPANISAGMRLRLPAKAKMTMETNNYFTEYSSTGAAIVNANGAQMTYVAAFSNHVTPSGDIQTISDQPLITAAKAQSVQPLLCIANYAGDMFSPDLAHTILANDSINQRLIDNALELMKTKGYRGLNIDFEYVNPGDRQLYNAFLRKVADQLHAEGFLVSTALAPKTSATQSGQLYIAHDYPVHGDLCDFVVLMTYEWGWSGGPPLAVILQHESHNNTTKLTVLVESSVLGEWVHWRDKNSANRQG